MQKENNHLSIPQKCLHGHSFSVSKAILFLMNSIRMGTKGPITRAKSNFWNILKTLNTSNWGYHKTRKLWVSKFVHHIKSVGCPFWSDWSEWGSYDSTEGLRSRGHIDLEPIILEGSALSDELSE